MRFHVPLPPMSEDDPFSRVTHDFARMMKSLGHDVHEYQTDPADGAPYKVGDWTVSSWKFNNDAAIAEIQENLDGYLCVIGGSAHEPIAAACPTLTPVEFSIGYAGTFSQFRVWESYAWMHHIYGKENRDDGNFYDTVIPLYFNHHEFPYVEAKDDYILYCGRLAYRKGVHIAVELARAVDCELRVIGEDIGEYPLPDDVNYLGYVPREERNKLMASAKCLIAPTQYIEPFGAIVPEAQLCGTPTLTTDWGAFTETNIDGITGYRCRTLGEFIDGYNRLDQLFPSVIQKLAVDRFSMDRVRFKYQAYFEQLETLKDKGWYDTTSWAQHRRYEP